jgi:hypothetical protein
MLCKYQYNKPSLGTTSEPQLTSTLESTLQCHGPQHPNPEERKANILLVWRLRSRWPTAALYTVTQQFMLFHIGSKWAKIVIIGTVASSSDWFHRVMSPQSLYSGLLIDETDWPYSIVTCTMVVPITAGCALDPWATQEQSTRCHLGFQQHAYRWKTNPTRSGEPSLIVVGQTHQWRQC